MHTVVVNATLHGSEGHHKISSERHYTKIVSIVADISSGVHYISL